MGRAGQHLGVRRIDTSASKESTPRPEKNPRENDHRSSSSSLLDPHPRADSQFLWSSQRPADTTHRRGDVNQRRVGREKKQEENGAKLFATFFVHTSCLPGQVEKMSHTSGYLSAYIEFRI